VVLFPPKIGVPLLPPKTLQQQRRPTFPLAQLKNELFPPPPMRNQALLRCAETVFFQVATSGGFQSDTPLLLFRAPSPEVFFFDTAIAPFFLFLQKRSHWISIRLLLGPFAKLKSLPANSSSSRSSPSVRVTSDEIRPPHVLEPEFATSSFAGFFFFFSNFF